MRHAVITVAGKDRPGIIAAVTGLLFKNRANLEDISMTILEGEFAMMLIVELPDEERRGRILRELRAWEKKSGLTVFVKDIRTQLSRGEKHGRGTVPYLLSVVARDQMGIVYATSRLLSRAGLNITDLNCKILGRGRKAVYALLLEVDVPRTFSRSRLRRMAGELTAKFRSPVKFKPVESLAL